MKYVSLDLETTGIEVKNPSRILQVSMVVEDTKNLKPLKELPHFTCFIKQEEYTGEPFALAMNSWILDIISGRAENTKGYPIYSQKEWISKAEAFINLHFEAGNGKVPFAGKNLGAFDLQFMPQGIRQRVSHRIIDPTSMFINWETDSKPPSLPQIKSRLGIEGEVTHCAYDDALDVIRVLRTTYEKD